METLGWARLDSNPVSALCGLVTATISPNFSFHIYEMGRRTARTSCSWREDQTSILPASPHQACKSGPVTTIHVRDSTQVYTYTDIIVCPARRGDKENAQASLRCDYLFKGREEQGLGPTNFLCILPYRFDPLQRECILCCNEKIKTEGRKSLRLLESWHPGLSFHPGLY